MVVMGPEEFLAHHVPDYHLIVQVPGLTFFFAEDNLYSQLRPLTDRIGDRERPTTEVTDSTGLGLDAPPPHHTRLVRDHKVQVVVHVAADVLCRLEGTDTVISYTGISTVGIHTIRLGGAGEIDTVFSDFAPVSKKTAKPCKWKDVGSFQTFQISLAGTHRPSFSSIIEDDVSVTGSGAS